MIEAIKNIYTAKLELAKLEGIEVVTNLISKTLEMALKAAIYSVSFITITIIVSISVGEIFGNYFHGIALGALILLIASFLLHLYRNQLVIMPFKDALIKTINEEFNNQNK